MTAAVTETVTEPMENLDYPNKFMLADEAELHWGSQDNQFRLKVVGEISIKSFTEFFSFVKNQVQRNPEVTGADIDLTSAVLIDTLSLALLIRACNIIKGRQEGLVEDSFFVVRTHARSPISQLIKDNGLEAQLGLEHQD